MFESDPYSSSQGFRSTADTSLCVCHVMAVTRTSTTYFFCLTADALPAAFFGAGFLVDVFLAEVLDFNAFAAGLRFAGAVFLAAAFFFTAVAL
ncbi:MAG: hypothetical protein AAF671_04875, partial [Pseudomonadota bacterium]